MDPVGISNYDGLQAALTWQMSWEVFNVRNTPIFGQPSDNASSRSVASITSLSADPRVIQFAARFNF